MAPEIFLIRLQRLTRFHPQWHYLPEGTFVIVSHCCLHLARFKAHTYLSRRSFTSKLKQRFLGENLTVVRVQLI
jgi:hypothetical protein